MNPTVKYITHQNIDFNRWDNCVKASQTEFVYAESNVLNIMHPNWDAIVLNDYEHVFPVTRAKKFGIHYIFQPHFIQQLGLLGPSETNSELVDLCLTELQKKYKYTEYNLNYKNHTKLFIDKCSDQISITLNLGKSYDEIKNAYSKNLKRNLTNANNNKLQVTSDISFLSIIDLFRDNRGRTLKHLYKSHFNQLNKLLDYLKKKNKVEILGVVDKQNKLMAAAVLLNNKNKSVFFFSALSKSGKSQSAMPFLINKFIEEKAGSNRILDFMGSNQASLSRFYKSFGASEYVYLRFKNNSLPWPINQFKK